MAAYVRSSCFSCNKNICYSKISLSDETTWSIDCAYQPPFPEREHRIVGYCKGIYCLEYGNGTSLLWNTSRNEFKFLPPSELKAPPCPSSNCPVIDCTVRTVSAVRGLGFDPKSGDYKVVRLATTFYDHCSDCYSAKQAEVYSLLHNSWEEIGNEGEQNYVLDECATYMDGCGYWIGETSIISGNAQNLMICFDFSSHQFSILSLPPINGFPFYKYGNILTKYKKSIAFILYERMERPRKTSKIMFCWVRGASGEWIETMKFEFCGAERPLGFCGDFLLYEGADGGLLVFDSNQTLFRKIEGIHDYPHRMRLFPLVKSKVSLTPSKWPLIPHKRKRKTKMMTDKGEEDD